MSVRRKVLDIWPVPILECVNEQISVERAVESHSGVTSSMVVRGCASGLDSPMMSRILVFFIFGSFEDFRK